MSDKYRKEIEEILRRTEEVMPKEGSGPDKIQSKRSGSSFTLLSRLTGGRGLKISARNLMLTSFALLVLALILGVAKIGFVVPLVVAGLILFVVAYALFFVRPGGSSYEKRWRGRSIEQRLSLWNRFKRWLKG